MARCFTLAKELKSRCSKIFFISRDITDHFLAALKQEGIPIIRLQSGTNWEEDAAQSIAAIKELAIPTPDWLIVDQYELDSRWETQIRPYIKKIMVIDDLDNRNHDCDALLDQNLVNDMKRRYKNHLPINTKRFLGPGYALLQPLFRDLHAKTTPKKALKNILVFFGGASQDQLISMVIDAFMKLNKPEINLHVVNFSSNTNPSLVSQNIRTYPMLPSLAPLLADADLCIGGCGATAWERLCLGVPALVITLADNQVPIAEELSKRGFIRLLGHHDSVNPEIIFSALSTVIEEKRLQDWSAKCLEVVDGLGLEKIVDFLLTEKLPLSARAVTEEDEALLLKWVNDPLTRTNSFSTDIISPEDHHLWFTKKINDPKKCKIYIIEKSDGSPIGQVRFDLISKDDAEIDVTVCPTERKKGYGGRVIEIACSKFLVSSGVKNISAYIKVSNLSSQKSFEKSGFVRFNDTVINGQKVSHYKFKS